MNQLIPFDMNPVARGISNLPAHIQAAQGEMDANVAANSSLPQLRFKGKVWTVDMAGDQNVLTQSDGETPLGIVKVVILGANPSRSRAWYQGSYDPDKAAAPDCHSLDGVRPDDDVESPPANSCAACPMSKKGSKVTDNGKPSTACVAHKRVAVVPSTQLDFEPLFLRLPQTSIWAGEDAENANKGWYAFDAYLKFLGDRGCKNTALVSTAVKFDVKEAYPKLLFKAEGWLSEGDVAVVRGLIEEKGPEISAITGVPLEGTAPVAHITPPKTTRVVAPVVEEEEEEVAAPVVKPKPKPKAKAAPVVEEEEAAPAATRANALASVLSGWDD